MNLAAYLTLGFVALGFLSLAWALLCAAGDSDD